jgi:hypothetical protein
LLGWQQWAAPRNIFDLEEFLMKRMVAVVMLCLLAIEPLAFAGIGSDVTMYVGGTENQVKDGTEGKSSEKDEKSFVFTYKNGTLSIPYDQVNDLEYGQKAGRRLGLAIAVTPLALLSKKRKHYLTLGWKDNQDKQHAAVFQLGKGVVRTTIVTLEARTGRKLEYEDDEARKSGMGG